MKLRKFSILFTILLIGIMVYVYTISFAMASFTLKLDSLNPNDFNSDNYTQINQVVSLKVKDPTCIKDDYIITNKTLPVIIKIEPQSEGIISIDYIGKLAINTEESSINAVGVVSDTNSSTSTYTKTVNAGDIYYLMGNATDYTTITKIEFSSSNYFMYDENKDIYTWDFRASNATYSAGYGLTTERNSIAKINKNGLYYTRQTSKSDYDRSIKYTPDNDGELTITLAYTNGRDEVDLFYPILVTSLNCDNSDEENLATNVCYSTDNNLVWKANLKAGTTYYIMSAMRNDDSTLNFYTCYQNITFKVNNKIEIVNPPNLNSTDHHYFIDLYIPGQKGNLMIVLKNSTFMKEVLINTKDYENRGLNLFDIYNELLDGDIIEIYLFDDNFNPLCNSEEFIVKIE